MTDKPSTAQGYSDKHAVLVRETCLYVATKLGDLMDDMVVVGGLAPSLLVDQNTARSRGDAHVGTLDLDVGLTVALLNEGRYKALTARLRRAKFVRGTNAGGHPTRQRWKIDGPEPITIDFLIQPTRPGDRGGRLRDIEPDFAAIIVPGLHLAARPKNALLRLRPLRHGCVRLAERSQRPYRAASECSASPSLP